MSENNDKQYLVSVFFFFFFFFFLLHLQYQNSAGYVAVNVNLLVQKCCHCILHLQYFLYGQKNMNFDLMEYASCFIIELTQT